MRPTAYVDPRLPPPGAPRRVGRPARYRPGMSDLLAEPEGAALVAIERANGGELAPIAQVLWTQSQWMRPPGAEAFAASTGLLVDAGLVEYVEGQLGLTPRGRKVLRKVSGMPGDPSHLRNVVAVLAELEPDTAADPGSRPAPSPGDVRSALEEDLEVAEAGDSFGGPSGGFDAPVYERGQMFGGQWSSAAPPLAGDDAVDGDVADGPPSVAPFGDDDQR